MTGLGTPIANVLVSDLVAGNFPSSGQVAPISATLNANAGYNWDYVNSFNATNAMNVFDALTVPSDGLARGRDSFPTAEPLSACHTTPLDGQPLAAALLPESPAAGNSIAMADGSFVFVRTSEPAATGFGSVSQVRYGSGATKGVVSVSERQLRDAFFAGTGSQRSDDTQSDSRAAAQDASPAELPAAPLLDVLFEDVSGDVASSGAAVPDVPAVQSGETWAAPSSGQDQRGSVLLAGIVAGAALQDLARVLCDGRPRRRWYAR